LAGVWARRASEKKLGPPTYFCNFKFGTQLGFGTSLAKNNVLDQNWRGSGPGEYPKKLGPLRIFATVKASSFKYGTQIGGFGTSLPKTTLWTKIGGGLGQGSILKNWDPYVFLQPLKLAASNMVHKLGLGLTYQKRRLGPKLEGV